MKILYLCDEYPPCKHGGIGSVTQTLAREIVRKGHQVTVCGFYPYYRSALSYQDDFGVKIYRHFYGSNLLLKLARNNILGRFANIVSKFNSYTEFLRNFINEKGIDIIEIPDFNEAFRYSGPRFVKFPDFGIPEVIKLHGSYSFVNQLEKGLPLSLSIYKKEKYLIHNATKVLAVSNFSKSEAKGIFNYSKDISVIYNGISINKSVQYLERSGIHSVVFAGKLAVQKGVLSLIRAWGEVVKKIPNATLLLYGKSEFRIIEKFNNLITDATRESIEIKGFISSSLLPEIYSKASCAIFPSYVESFSMAPLESMQVGCPTIYTRRASGEELITNGINGLLIDPDNIQEIADAIIYMLNNRNSALTMGAKGAETIHDKFNISKIADEHLKLYTELINNQK